MAVQKKPRQEQQAEAAWYKGRQAQTGNSLGLRFDKALFRSHPEFNGDVQARVIGPGRMLVVAQRLPKARPGSDPVIASFLSFLAKDMTHSPQHVSPLDRSMVRRLNRLTAKIETDLTEDLGDHPLS